MSLDPIILFLRDFALFVQEQFATRTAMDWVFFFMPFVVFFEFPRYYFPLVGLVVAKWLGYPKYDEISREALLESEPLVSVVIAGRNEAETIESAIVSLLDQNYSKLEIIVVDDASDDEMAEVVRKYARRGQVRLVRNRAERGRAGRPSATNLGVRVANGEFVVSLDADTTFDRHMIRSIIAPFADPRVGVVAGSVLPRNTDENLLTRLQTLEYAFSIDLRKRWTDLIGCTLQASGAIGAFRRSAVMKIGNWDPELAEDADISLRMTKAGWKVAFAPQAVALTEVPTRLRVLRSQRVRWDRGGLRAYVKKHWRLLNPKMGGWLYAKEMWAELFSLILSTVLFPFYMGWLLWQGLFLTLFVLLICFSIYVVVSILSVGAIAVVSERIRPNWRLLAAATLVPFYKEIFRFVRMKALVLELMRVRYEDSYIPRSSYANAPRF